ncbi:MAG: hypothetical protein CMK59_01300 [Proteobacteria bacterium]|nr:hypothetical protein [Pseudomonadota bacterium]
MSDNVSVEIIKRPAIQMLSAKLPIGFVSELIRDSEILAAQSKRQNYADHLVGNFKNGEQIAIKSSEDNDYICELPSFKTLGQIKLNLAQLFIEQYAQEVGRPYAYQKLDVCDMWLNIQQEADFNPLHSHSTYSNVGLSSFAWLSFPQEVLDNVKNGVFDDRNQAGWTHIHYGKTPSYGDRFFMFPQKISLVPEIGKLYLFPSWLEHVVYPFKGDGQRVSIATNINIWT